MWHTLKLWIEFMCSFMSKRKKRSNDSYNPEDEKKKKRKTRTTKRKQKQRTRPTEKKKEAEAKRRKREDKEVRIKENEYIRSSARWFKNGVMIFVNSCWSVTSITKSTTLKGVFKKTSPSHTNKWDLWTQHVLCVSLGFIMCCLEWAMSYLLVIDFLCTDMILRSMKLRVTGFGNAFLWYS